MTRDGIGAPEIARLLAERADQLAPLLLPGGRRERGRDWRCGSVAGEAGTSLIVCLAGNGRGRWRDFATSEGGDMLDLVAATQQLGTSEAMAWARRWLGLDQGEARVRPVVHRVPEPLPDNADRWRLPWDGAVPIAGTLAATYLAGRGLTFVDPHGDVLRFAGRRARRSPADVLEHHPAMLALLRDVLTGGPCGLVNVFLLGDGCDRIRDAKGKTVTGRAGGAAVMLGDFADVTYGLAVCEGVETAIKVDMDGQSPVWALGGAGNLARFPVLPGMQCLTVAADADAPGQAAAREVAARWRAAGREVRTITPPNDDWADQARRAAQ